MDRAEEIKAKALELVAQNKGRELMSLPGWWYLISAESYLDRLVSIPNTITLAPDIKCPVLAIRGDKEDQHRYPAEEFKAACGGPCDFHLIADCDHFYNGKEDVVANLITSWLEKNTPSSI